jgi:tetratricopeptide (TPR) repeat protein
MNDNLEELDLTRHGLDEAQGKKVVINSVTYSITDQLGEGGEGVVYNLLNLKTGCCLFALKIFKFRREAPEYARKLTLGEDTFYSAMIAMGEQTDPFDFRCPIWPIEMYEQNGGLLGLMRSFKPSRPYSSAIEQGEKMYSAGAFDKGLEVFDNILAHHPTNNGALHSRALCLSNLGRVGDAIKCMTLAYELEPNEVSHYVELSRIYTRLSNIDSAIKTLTANLRRCRYEVRSWYALLWLATTFDRVAECKEWIEPGLKLAERANVGKQFAAAISESESRATSYKSFLDAALANQLSKEWDAALSKLNEAISVSNGNSVARLNRAICMYRKGNYESALSGINEVFYAVDSRAAQASVTLLLMMARALTGDWHGASQLVPLLDTLAPTSFDAPRFPLFFTNEAWTEDPDPKDIIDILREIQMRYETDMAVSAGVTQLIAKYEALAAATSQASAVSMSTDESTSWLKRWFRTHGMNATGIRRI